MSKTVNARGWWKVSFDINLEYEGELDRFGEGISFDDLSEISQEHILKCISKGCTQGELIEKYETDDDDDEGEDEKDDPDEGCPNSHDCGHCNLEPCVVHGQ